ncbi:CotH kinase family protein [candidate division KSB1 bacterium]|nr:CotH kinase family protein [candidate division KSB1 bacterium]
MGSTLLQILLVAAFTSSNLPIVFLDTGGKRIPESDPRIVAEMGIVDNGLGNRNNVSDDLNGYDGLINIEIRGSSSAGWAKKQYNVETQLPDGTLNNVSLLGLPAENDWILNAPYIDKSLIRNVLTYHLARKMGRYAPRTRYCEVVLNGEYQGVYILMEKIKRDRNRVDISEMNSSDVTGDAVTGGYMIKIDKPGDDFFVSDYTPANGTGYQIKYQYHYPKDRDILPQQKVYIQQFIKEFEDVLAGSKWDDPVEGYSRYIDVDSWVDYMVIAELAKNVDAYRLSHYMHKDRDSIDGRLYMGPVWDYNLAYGLANYYDGTDTDDWMLEELSRGNDIRHDGNQIPFWMDKLFFAPEVKRRFYQRWDQLRQDILSLDYLKNYINSVADTLDEAQKRNFEIWTGPGEPKARRDGFWPVPEVFYTFQTYSDEVNYLISWITNRIHWIDENIAVHAGASENPGKVTTKLSLFQNYPNPFNPATRIEFDLMENERCDLTIYNLWSRKVRSFVDVAKTKGRYSVEWDGKDDRGAKVPSGVYFYRLKAGSVTETKKMILAR